MDYMMNIGHKKCPGNNSPTFIVIERKMETKNNNEYTTFCRVIKNKAGCIIKHLRDGHTDQSPNQPTNQPTVSHDWI